jgi:predicted RNA-binding Zn-ribbon protein involved in translation (DUF1610 family)
MKDDVILDVTCPRCGPVELEPDEAWLVLASEPALSHYAFACPDCGGHVRHHADATVVGVLAPLLATETLCVPAEALEVSTGPALTTDDLIDFCLALESFTTLDVAAAATLEGVPAGH